MKTWEIQGAYGIDNLRIAERAEPQPGPGQIVVAMKAASLNYRDLTTIRGGLPHPLPLIPFSDGAGEVVAVGHFGGGALERGAEAVEGGGGTSDAYTQEDSTCYYARVPAERQLEMLRTVTRRAERVHGADSIGDVIVRVATDAMTPRPQPGAPAGVSPSSQVVAARRVALPIHRPPGAVDDDMPAPVCV